MAAKAKAQAIDLEIISDTASWLIPLFLVHVPVWILLISYFFPLIIMNLGIGTQTHSPNPHLPHIYRSK